MKPSRVSSDLVVSLCVSERSEAARVLLELGAKAGKKDSDGQLCITALIAQMSPVVTMPPPQPYHYLNCVQQFNIFVSTFP